MKIRKKYPPDFRKPNKKQQGSSQWYDVDFDAVLIEQSIAKQYGVLPSEQENLKYSDWAKMVSGLMDDTPLGRVVWVRSENNEEMLKNFTQEQKQIRQEWRDFQYQSAPKISEEEQRKQIDMFEKMFASMFG